ncbi:MAG: CDP-diacylglycerol--glycerol-3-phosphate 3-phosphatidyltransferase [Clostridiaceae bacterium]|nr:CDP-diacylglycerol--glycerol-3-phosphate 3-phosphatidyltransferase [Clostridiaceae bacterium]
MTIPNILTMIRVLLIPVFMFCAVDGSALTDWLAVVIFCVASFTDFVDGYLARKYNQITNFGKFMDPLADKLLVMSALLIFVERGTVPAWAAVVILGREFTVTSLRMVAAAEGKVIAANYWGKAKTLTTMICLILLLIRVPPVTVFSGFTLQDLLVWLMVIVTVISGYTYVKDNFSVIKDGFTQKGE